MCIAHNNCMSCPSIWATLSTLLINILLSSFQLFLHSDQPLSEGEIIPFSGVCQSGEAASYPRRRRWWLHALTDRLLFDVQPTTIAATSSRRHRFSCSANSSCVCISATAVPFQHVSMSVVSRVRQPVQKFLSRRLYR